MKKRFQYSYTLNKMIPKKLVAYLVFVVILFPLLAACSTSAEANLALSETSIVLTAMTNPCFDSGCHSELIIAEEEYKHRPYVDQQCLVCHEQYHNEEVQHGYLQHDIVLCLTCHPDALLGNTHPVGEGIIDPNTQQMMTCTSTCHRQHTAPYPYLLALSGSGELCVSCHQEFLE